MREGDTRTGSGGGGRFGNGLVVAEIAIAFALLVGASLLVKNLILLQRRDAGIQTARIVAFDVATSGPRYRDADSVRNFYRDVLDRLAGIGGVESVGAVSQLPMYQFGANGEVTIEGGNPWNSSENPLVEQRRVAGRYFETMGIRLTRGRSFTAADGASSQPVVVINRAMADKFWPGQDPIGKRVSPGSSRNWLTVVGVVDNVRSFGLSSIVPYEMYRSIDQQPSSALTIVMRTQAEDPASAVQAARQIVNTVDPALPIAMVQTMEQVVSASVRQPRLLSALSGVFGALAGLLAMVGVYGVTAYNVRRQRREFGIRLALGADSRAVERLVLLRGIAHGCRGGSARDSCGAAAHADPAGHAQRREADRPRSVCRDRGRAVGGLDRGELPACPGGGAGGSDGGVAGELGHQLTSYQLPEKIKKNPVGSWKLMELEAGSWKLVAISALHPEGHVLGQHAARRGDAQAQGVFARRETRKREVELRDGR